MCLEYVDEPKEQAGYAYKYVKQTDDPNVFLPEWEFFQVGSCGTRGGYNSIPNKAVYSLLKTYVVPNGSGFTAAYLGPYERYEVGVHLYKKVPSYARRPNGGWALIRCHYNKAIAEDDEVVVAGEVTPIEVVARGMWF